jgi:hypothetical protein
VESVVAGIPIRPADEPLDEIDAKWSAGMLSHLGGGLESGEGPAPTTQGEAAVAVQGAAPGSRTIGGPHAVGRSG